MRKTRADVTRLNTELVAAKIAALTQTPLAPAREAHPEPTRRKRHLALYIGGGAVAFLASFGDRFRELMRRRRRTAMAVAASSVLITGTAAAYYTSVCHDMAPSAAAPVTSSTADTNDGGAPYPAPGPSAELRPDNKNGSETKAATAVPEQFEKLANTSLTPPAQLGDTLGSHRADSRNDRPKPPEGRPEGGPSAQPPAPPAETQPPQQHPSPTPPPAPEPSAPPATTPPPRSPQGLCLQLLLHICTGTLP
jgi:hypothetical protein